MTAHESNLEFEMKSGDLIELIADYPFRISDTDEELLHGKFRNFKKGSCIVVVEKIISPNRTRYAYVVLDSKANLVDINFNQHPSCWFRKVPRNA